MNRQRLVANLALCALLITGAAKAAAPDISAMQPVQSLGGETCRVDGTVSGARPVEIFCGDNSLSVGRVQVYSLGASLPQEVGARRTALLARATTIADALSISEQLTCDPGQFLTGPGGGETLLFICSIDSNSWPRIVLVSGSDRTIYQAEGLPGMLAVLSAAIGTASGRPVAAGEIAAGQRLLAARFPSNVLLSGTVNSITNTQYMELARVYGSANDFAAAETAIRNALDIDTRLFGEDSAQVGLALMELALQVSNQGRFDEAAGLFRRAAPTVQALPSIDARARLNSYMALDAANQRDFAKALAFARQATADRRAELEAANGQGGSAAGFTGLATVSSGELAHSLRIEAEMALQLDDVSGAQAAAEEALWIISLEPGLALWWRADVLSLMAQVNERQGRVAAAERNFLDALALRQKLFNDGPPVVLSQLRLGKFYTDSQLYPAALEHFRAAMAILAKNPVARSRIVTDQILAFITAAAASTADPQQRATLDAEIFRSIQLVNSDVADQAIARVGVRVAAADPMLANLVRQAQESQRTRDNMRINLAAEFAKPTDERDAARESQLQQNLTAATARTDELLARVQQTFPDYAKLTNAGPAELSDVRAQLGSGEAFLSFVVGFRGSYGLLVTQRGLTVKRLDVASETLAADIVALRRAFVPQLGRLPDFSLRNAYALYSQLLAPFAADLKDVDHLIVSPGAVLANLPLGLLVSSAPDDTTTYGTAAWLIRDMAVSQVPSPRAFLSLRQSEKTRRPATRPFLGLGDPLLTGAAAQAGGPSGAAALDALAQSCRQSNPASSALLRALPPLHDTAEEVRAVSRALGGDAGSVLLGANADEAGLRAQPLDQFRVIYFATHGLLPGELHCQTEPGLVLSPPAADAPSADTDGLLEASEVAVLKLNADLVVLSACNTAAAGDGRFGGDALEGLADAFFNAGARAVLASHWEVPSAETTQLMTGVFERYGKDGMRSLAEALRQSQLALTGQTATAHPFNWAAFTLIGVSAAPAMIGQDGGGDSVRVQRRADNGDRQ